MSPTRSVYVAYIMIFIHIREFARLKSPLLTCCFLYVPSPSPFQSARAPHCQGRTRVIHALIVYARLTIYLRRCYGAYCVAYGASARAFTFAASTAVTRLIAIDLAARARINSYTGIHIITIPTCAHRKPWGVIICCAYLYVRKGEWFGHTLVQYTFTRAYITI